MARQEKFRDRLNDRWRDPLIGQTLLAGLSEALKSLRDSVNAIRECLEKNPLTGPAAMAAARELGKSGNASISVDEYGQFWLEVDMRVGTDGKRPWSSNLPSLPALRKEAEELGVDISKMGRSKTLILKAIETARRNAAEQTASVSDHTPRPKMVKIAPAVTPPVIVTSDNESASRRQIVSKPSNNTPDKH